MIKIKIINDFQSQIYIFFRDYMLIPALKLYIYKRPPQSLAKRIIYHSKQIRFG